MNSTMIALGIASVMIMLGLWLRAKVKPLGKMLVPTCVIGGILGLIFMNVIAPHIPMGGVDVDIYTNIVNVLFTISFIAIGLSSSEEEKTEKNADGKKQSGMVRGALGMGIIWSLLYGLTSIIGVLLIGIIGKPLGMDAMYGILIPFGFCQGPGQAATYGTIFADLYGYQNADMVAISFAVIGFIFAFLFGVPLAKYGIKKGYTKYKTTINESVERGILYPKEQKESMGTVTTHSANIESLAVHVAVICICYLLGLGIAEVIAMIPVVGESFAAMTFLWGMMAASIVKSIMKKLGIYYLLSSPMVGKITGLTSDYLVVCAFMAIQMSTIGVWIVPILVECLICAIITFVICFYFGARLGSDHDFERILGLYGTSTGTVPSGVALVRMVDTRLKTPTTIELGMMNMAMMLNTPVMILITLAGLGTISLMPALAGIAVCIIVFLILLKVTGCWRKPEFTLKNGYVNK